MRVYRKKLKKELGTPNFLNRIFIGSSKNYIYIIDNLSLLLSSGMDVLRALDSIKESTKSKFIKKVVDQIKTNVDSGFSLSEALHFSSIFPEKTISLIRIGEKSGRLVQNLKVASEQQKKEQSLRQKIKAALMYPIFILTVAIIVGLGTSWFILPKLAVVFSQLKIKLPPITKFFIDLGSFLGKYGNIVVPSFLIGFFLLVYFIFFFKYTKIVGQFITFHLPIFRTIIQETELARLGYLLGGLLESGVPITEAIRSVRDGCNFYNYRKFYKFLESSIEEGNSFQKSFSAYQKINDLIPPTVQQLISGAERSGNLPVVFKNIGSAYEERVDNTTKNLTVILEPVLLVIVWLGVMCVSLAVILPIYGLIGGFNSGSYNQAPSPVIVKKKPSPSNISASINKKAEETAKKTSQKILFISSPPSSYVNIRESPSTSGQIIKKAAPGEKFEYTETKDNWYKIILPEGNFGWIFGNYVKTQ